MVSADKEAVAGLRVLVCMAQADGVLHPEERKELVAALEAIELPPDVTLDSFLEEGIDLDEQLDLIESRPARIETFRSAYGMACADGERATVEQDLLDHIAKVLEIPDERVREIEEIFRDDATDERPSTFSPIEDPEERAATVKRETMKCSFVAALFGAFPLPGFAILTDLAVVGLQINLVRDIGQMWGKAVDKKSAKSMLGAFGVGSVARLAVNNLAKLLPGWGSAVGAATSFASTYAVGEVIQKHFEKGGDVGDVETLKAEFKKAEKEGKKAYKEKKDDIKKKEAATKEQLVELQKECKEGRISQAEFRDRASKIVEEA